MVLSLDTGWSLGEDTFAVLCDLLAERPAGTVVEFGSGASTIRLAATFPEAKVLSIEHSFEHYQRVCSLAKEWLQGNNLALLHLPLEYGWYGLSRILTYRRHAFRDQVSAAIIDGPPYFTLRGREACLYQVYGALPIGGIVVIDDYQRRHEQVIVRNWLETYPGGFELRSYPVGHGLAVLRKRTHSNPRRFPVRRLRDNLGVNHWYLQQDLKDRKWFHHFSPTTESGT